MIPSRLPPSSGGRSADNRKALLWAAKGLLSPAGRQPFERSEVGLFSFGRSPVVWFSPPKAAFILAPERAPTSPAERYFIPPEGGALNPPVRRSRSQAEPLAPRAKGPAAPSTLARRASTFGNTGKRRISHKSPSPQMSHTAKKH